MNYIRKASYFCLYVIIAFFIGCSSSDEVSQQTEYVEKPNRNDELLAEKEKLLKQSKASLDSAKNANRKLQEDIDRTRQENQNLNNRIAELESKIDEQKLKVIEESYRIEYNNALKSFSEKKYGEAIARFQKLYNDDPSNELAPNCLYWIGECYYGMKDYKQAILAFEQVISAYHDSQKKEPAMLMIGNSYLKLKDKINAKEAYNRLQETAPESIYVKKIPKAFRKK